MPEDAVDFVFYAGPSLIMAVAVFLAVKALKSRKALKSLKGTASTVGTLGLLSAVVVVCAGFMVTYAEVFGGESSVTRVDEPPSLDDQPYDKVP